VKNKIFYWGIVILQALFLVTAYGIQFFSVKKMGMMRYVLYLNREWEAQYPIATLQYAAIALLVVLFIGIILYARTKVDNNFMDRKLLLMLIVEVIVTLTFVVFTFAYSTESYRSYYFACIILAITAILQDIKILVYLKEPKNSRGITF
jgi:hypothetical protein